MDAIRPCSNTCVSAIYFEQVIHFQFGFGTNGTKTLWPHIQCNTLIRQRRAVAEEANGKRSRTEKAYPVGV